MGNSSARGRRVYLAAVLTILSAALALTACSGNRSRGSGFQPTYYKVAKGDTLYSIAWRYQVDHEALIRWNAITAPYTIYPGQRIALQPPQPGTQGQTSLLKLPTPPQEQSAASASQPAAGTAQQPTATASAGTAGAPASTPGKAPAAGAWRWPTSGKVVKKFDARNKRSLGIDISGKTGQPVRASARGQVVYSGSGLANYGNLIIIKHDPAYLSAYAHNQRLLVREGASVAAGQVIAEMGRDDDDRAVLHFEIRRHGKPTDPLRYLAR